MQNRRGGDIAGDQQQQLSIARALIIKPKLLLLDEPTERIQPNIIQQIGKVITCLGGWVDMAILLVEQYFDFTFEHAGIFFMLRRGRVVGSGTKKGTVRAQFMDAVSV
ncbi:ATP-binding cassette domain-containing protein [Pseudohalocynthiibacter aestuariivivens]|jgi:urea transport system ATP-binding protein|nr:ATP-binding cassette domain-containing protein [Pseudohalocynthiibacter aestuariivivens]